MLKQKWQRYMVGEAVFLRDLQARDRNGVIRELVEAILSPKKKYDETTIKDVAKATIGRERMGSTGFGKGVACPHVKHAALDDMYFGWGRCLGGVDFAALDRAPVYFVSCQLSPANNPELHLGGMELLFRMLQRDGVRKDLLRAETSEGMKRIVSEFSDGE